MTPEEKLREEVVNAHSYTIKVGVVAELEVFPGKCLLLRNQTAEYAQVTVGNTVPRTTVAAALRELLGTVAGLPVADYSTDGDGAELIKQDAVLKLIDATIAKLGLEDETQEETK